MPLPKEYISYSQINTYLNCGKQYYYRYIAQEKSTTSFKLTTGKETHNLLSKIYTDIINKAPKKFKEYVPEFRESFKSQYPNASNEEITIVGGFLAEIENQIRTYDPLYSEYELNTDYKGIRIKGFIDLVTTDNRVVDFKFTDRPSKFQNPQKSLQLGLYGYFYDTKYVEYACYTSQISKAGKALHSFHNYQGELEKKNIIQALNILEDAVEGIDKGVFTRTDPDSWVCSKKYCDYYEICYGEERKEPLQICV